jgi:hypothetical protein
VLQQLFDCLEGASGRPGLEFASQGSGDNDGRDASSPLLPLGAHCAAFAAAILRKLATIGVWHRLPYWDCGRRRVNTFDAPVPGRVTGLFQRTRTPHRTDPLLTRPGGRGMGRPQCIAGRSRHCPGRPCRRAWRLGRHWGWQLLVCGADRRTAHRRDTVSVVSVPVLLSGGGVAFGDGAPAVGAVARLGWWVGLVRLLR